MSKIVKRQGGSKARGTCDVRRATCDVRRATCDVRRATCDKKNRRSAKATICQNTDSTNDTLVEKSVVKLEIFKMIDKNAYFFRGG